MAFAKVYSAQSFLLKTYLVSVEIDLSRGLHAFSIVGLPDKGIEESKDRVSAAIKNSGFKSPKQINKKVVVSLAPADMRKEGPLFDLPIALAYLLAEKHILFETEGKLFAGELALDGSIRPIRGALSYARLAHRLGIRELYVPMNNAAEASLIEGVSVFGLNTLKEAIDHLNGTRLIKPTTHTKEHFAQLVRTDYSPSWDDIAGHESVKRGLIIAIAGGHNVALFGPAGTGKTMLVKALASILPDLSFEEMLEVTEIYSLNGLPVRSHPVEPPLRSPHHTSTYSSIIGGGLGPKAGEITLAHRGVLFMDEFPEFDSRVIECLRQPLEERVVSIARSKGTVQFPASFMLVTAFNPCPCGNKDIQGKICRCSAKDMNRYRKKISGPIMDRIDMWIEVSKVDHNNLIRRKNNASEVITARTAIQRMRKIQTKRFEKLGKDITLNSHVNPREMGEVMKLDKEGEEVLRNVALSYGLSGRRYHRIIKLARTIADFEESDSIQASHILEALQYRQKE